MTSDDTPSPQPWLVLLLGTGGARVPLGKRLQLNGLHIGGGERANVTLTSRFEDQGLTDLVPHELVLEVRCLAGNAEEAVSKAEQLGVGLASIFSFVLNAYVDIPAALLAYECAPDLTERKFRHYSVPTETGIPRPSRPLDETTLFPLMSAIEAAGESARVARAASQYNVALRDWTPAGQTLAMAHLYMALEALAPAIEKVERARLNLSDMESHAQHRGVDTSKPNWRNVLLGWIRRDVICQGDQDTYSTARKASDGLEHGFMDLPEIRESARLTSGKLIRYVREGMLTLLNLPPDLTKRVAATRPVDVSPLKMVLEGRLTGSVADPMKLGQGGSPYPDIDWNNHLADYVNLPDGRARVSPTINVTSMVADGVAITFEGYGIGIGLTEQDVYEYTRADENHESPRANQTPPTV